MSASLRGFFSAESQEKKRKSILAVPDWFALYG